MDIDRLIFQDLYSQRIIEKYRLESLWNLSLYYRKEPKKMLKI